MNWSRLSLVEQMANIGSEVGRTIIWKRKKPEYARMAFYRALDLFSKTIKDTKNKSRLKEICRAKEMLIDWWLGNRLYRSTDQEWTKYFTQFNYAARINH